MSYSVDSYHAMQDRVAALEDCVSERDTKITELRAAVAKAEAERDALKQDIEDRDRAIDSLRLKVDTAHGQIDALKARAERLAAECRAGRRVECSALGDGSSAELADRLVELEAARAAVDAAGDLEARG